MIFTAQEILTNWTDIDIVSLGKKTDPYIWTNIYPVRERSILTRNENALIMDNDQANVYVNRAGFHQGATAAVSDYEGQGRGDVWRILATHVHAARFSWT